MILISHRGNINEKNISLENSPKYILNALNLGFDVEIDVWKIKETFFLGHDKPQYEIDIDFLKNHKFWCHAKNVQALQSMLENNIHCFWHQEDDYTVTSKGFIWVYPNKLLYNNCVAVIKEETKYEIKELKKCYAICSDNINIYKELL